MSFYYVKEELLMKKITVAELKEKVMKLIMAEEKRVMSESKSKVDDKEEISTEEAMNVGKMLLTVTLVKGLEELFKEVK